MAARRVRKPTPNQLAWKKEEQRIRRFIKNAEKRGFVFDKFALPSKPARITAKQLSLIKSIRPETLYATASYKVPGTSQIVSGLEGRRIERSAAAKKGKVRSSSMRTPSGRRDDPTVTDTGGQAFSAEELARKHEAEVVLRNVREIIREWEPGITWSAGMKVAKRSDRNILSSILEAAIAQWGEEEVVRRLQNSAEDINHLLDVVLYESGGGEGFNTGRERAQAALVRMASILKGERLTLEERIEYSEAEEAFEDGEEYLI